MKAFCMVFACSCLIGSAGAQSLRSQLDASNAGIDKVLLAKDAVGFKKYLKDRVTPDFKYVEGDTTMNFDQMCAGMAMGLGPMKKVTRAERKLLALKEKGDKATATTLHVIEGTIRGKSGKPHKLAFIGTSSDSYVKQAGKWKLAKMAMLKQSMTIDGKPPHPPVLAPTTAK